MFLKRISTAAAVAAIPSTLWAQASAFQTPGMPTYPTGGQGPAGDISQANRFTAGFNPAFSFVIDAVADYLSPDTGPSGWDMTVRNMEIMSQAWVDPNAWAYFVAASDGEALNVEEAAAHFVGLGEHTTLRVGKFFIDFGKQMQTHVHELRTVERPLVLRQYLGEEIKGEGVELDQWYAIGDKTALRWSVGAFASLLPEESPDFLPVTESVADRKSGGKFNYTARVTGFTDVGEAGIFQLGASARVIPQYEFTYDPSGATAQDLKNSVFGVDATYGWTDETGLRKWTFGGEFLVDTGDGGAAINDNGTPTDPTDDTINVVHQAVNGYFAWADYQWSPFNSVGLQYSALQLPDFDKSNESETAVYWSHSFSEFQRLRLEVSDHKSDVADSDSTRLALQYSLVLGAHGHGVNW
jgi:hypothetical protein